MAHDGDPRIAIPIAEYNEGIPIAAIRGALPADVLAKLRWPRPAG